MEPKIITQALPVDVGKAAKTLFFITLSVLSFVAPFSLGHPQWLVGTIVNAGLFLGALYLPKKLYAPLIILPALGVLARGVIFGPLTSFLLYFLPFIWLGNLALILVFKKSFAFKFIPAMLIASAAKFLLLYLVANVYFKINIVPALFLQAMGLSQLLTAISGGLVAFVLYKSYGRINSGNKGTN